MMIRCGWVGLFPFIFNIVLILFLFLGFNEESFSIYQNKIQEYVENHIEILKEDKDFEKVLED
jgi:hypothetical protein